jgi:hypothetical protein
MKKSLALSGIALATLLSGCSVSTPVPQETVTITATPTPTTIPTQTKEAKLTSNQKDAIFISTMRDKYPRTTNTDEELISLADSACRAFSRGASYADVAAAVIDNAGSQVGVFAFAIGAGVVVYCPQHMDKMP